MLEAYRAKLLKALEVGGNLDTIESLEADVAAGRMQVFTVGESVVLTQIQDYPQEKVLQICYVAGSLDDMEPWLEAVMAWAEREGCSRAYMVGRAGWLRSFLSKSTWEQTNVVMERKLCHSA